MQKSLLDQIINLSKFFELASWDKIYVTGLNLHESGCELLLNYTGDFVLNGTMGIAPVEQKKTNIRFRNLDDFGSYIKTSDIDYDSVDVTFTG